LILKPARRGTSIIAGGPVRAVVELAGIKNVVCKSFGSANKNNMVKATLLALRKLKVIDKGSLEKASQVKEEVKGGATKEEVLREKQESKSKLKRVNLDKEEGKNET